MNIEEITKGHRVSVIILGEKKLAEITNVEIHVGNVYVGLLSRYTTIPGRKKICFRQSDGEWTSAEGYTLIFNQ